MGWLFTHGASKQDMVKHLLDPANCNPYTPLEHSVRGNEMWVLFEHKESKHKSIALFLLGSDRNYGWGYKDMDESMGPAYYSCPLKFLDAAPQSTSKYAADWRAKVREWHAKQAAKAKLKRSSVIGASIEFVPGCTAAGTPLTVHKVVSIKPIRVQVGFMQVRVRPRHIAGVLR